MDEPPHRWAADPDRIREELVQAQKMEAIGAVVAGLAHELNNPLAAIVGFSQLLSRDPRLPDDLRTNADLLVQEADRTRRIVGSLLEFARRRPPERHPTPIGPLVRSVLDLQAYLLVSAAISVEVDVPDDLPPVPIDRAQMQQALLNLTLNAIQAIRARGDGGRISIRAHRPDGAADVVHLEVIDDGPGVPPELRDRLFVPFFTTKPTGDGSGLGLPVSYGIVTAHGGRLRFEPPPAGGAKFVIELPAARADSAVAVPSPRASELGAAGDAGPPKSPAASAARPRVLVIDDEPAIRRLLARALAAIDCEVVLAEDGSTAIELVRDGPVDAVLCDHRMAGLTGAEVFEMVVAARPELADRFVLMSGDVHHPEMNAFLERRGVGLLAKPFDVDAVRRTVRAVLEKGPPQSRG